MGGWRSHNEHPSRKAHHRSYLFLQETSLPSLVRGEGGCVMCPFLNQVQRARETACWPARPVSHVPREAEARLPEEGAVWREDMGQTRACAPSLTVPVRKGP